MNVRRHNIGNQFLSSIVEVAGYLYSKMADRISKRRKNSKQSSGTTNNDYEYVYLQNEDTNDGEKKNERFKGLQGDYGNILLLTFLYVLQGIPLGLGGSIPMLLQSRKVSYKEQAVFSFIYWPFSIKLLWAPLVDSLYFHWFGRRKSWMVPTQYLIGVFMLVLSTRIDDLLGIESDEPEKVDVMTLTFVFFCLNFLAATQDIAVDGWALTMLARRNVGWASTCNTVGQTAGYFLGNVLFLALESADFCNKYLRSEPKDVGILTLASFLYFWGIVFFVTTTLVWMLKSEKVDPEVDPEQGIVETYKQLYKVMRLSPVISHCIVLITSKVGFAAADSLSGLKLIEAGMSKTTLALFAIPMVPVQIILPLIISKYTAGPRPLNVFLKAIPARLLLGILYAYIVYLAHHVQDTPGQFPTYFYALMLGSYMIHQVFVYSMFVSQMAFHAKISDPVIGGTYMTLLNTVANLGGNWPATVALWVVDGITWKSCEGAEGHSCYTADTLHECKEAGGTCVTTFDGYYVESALCIVIGFLWLFWRSKKVRQLDALDMSAWKVS
ncbi:acetyl-coenzyme A transporter 1-like [Mercenaria mercenaria]|uniref:acetyl-coenzyme A transporter 1-like n=1 Tax=Mercenaria mercenaria TaxID=6596 RepID=UPI00234F30F3|nr:acetyl-coenzyme A transporter 1-like [Mercenaria mercenaria]XP_045163197.2 acetyl-coenzyme A transporter 1-like [Mercenaria mercenaria]XP_045163198.2 acetyl-coenzyme A transporter 1-like [Mercenaria mercenaria]